MKILLGPEYLSDEEDQETDSEEASEGEQEDARDTFVDRITVSGQEEVFVDKRRWFFSRCVGLRRNVFSRVNLACAWLTRLWFFHARWSISSNIMLSGRCGSGVCVLKRFFRPALPALARCFCPPQTKPSFVTPAVTGNAR